MLKFNMFRQAQKYLYSFKYIVKNKLPDETVKYISKILSKRNSSKYLEKQKNFGDGNPKTIFYVIRRKPPGWGFFSNIFYVLQGLDYSEKKGFIPVVDMENYWVAELSSLKSINNTKNAWCYFFEQVSTYSLDEVYKSKQVVLSNGLNILGSKNWLTNRNTDLATSSHLLNNANILINKYIKLNENTQDHVMNIKGQINWKAEETLGIFIRGAVYFQDLRFLNKAVPDLEVLIKEIRVLIELHSPKKVYISTEDFRLYTLLQDAINFPYLIPSIRFNSAEKIEKWKLNQTMNNQDGLKSMGYERTLDYLTEMYLLIDCKDFICTFSNASVFVLAARNRNLGARHLILKNEVIHFENDLM